MQRFNELIMNHPINKVQRELRKQQVLEAFPDYVDEATFDQWHLMLYRFATVRPLIYHSPQTVSDALTFFNKNPDITFDAITAFQRELTHAILSLLRPGSSWGREEPLKLDTPQHLFEFESVWHPEYQRYSEHVFNHLIQIPLRILEVEKTRPRAKKKDYVDMALSERVKCLRNNGLPTLTMGFDSVVRNAISHGQVDFGLYQIVYIDSRDQRQFGSQEFSELFDSLVDTCHSILIVLLLFVCDHKPLVQKRGVSCLPLGLRFILVDALASNERFQILSMMESQSAKGAQLNIACRIDSRARNIQRWEAISACWHAAILGGQAYDRFAVNLDCGASIPASAFLDGRVLQEATANDWTVEQCADAKLLEAELLWYDVPRSRGRFDNWRTVGSLIWKLRMERDLVQQWRQAGLRMLGTRYKIRHVANKSAGDFRIIEAYIVFHDRGNIRESDLQAVVKHIVKRLRRHKIRLEDVGGEKGRRRRPAYVRMRLFARDGRVRTLAPGGWKGGNQILIAEWFSPWKNNGALLVKRSDAIVRRIRIQYNPNLVVADKSNVIP
jgi:hypothetical protein